MVNSDIKDLADWAKSQGWTVKDDQSGYTRFFDPQGNYVTHYPASPSRPVRRRADLEVALRKVGLQAPPLSRKEQRAARNKAKKRQGKKEQER
jgi:hypothetical protein